MAGKPVRGMVVLVELDPVVGHEQGRTRPCVIVQNDIGNRYSSTTVVGPLTDASHVKKPSPVYVLVKKVTVARRRIAPYFAIKFEPWISAASETSLERSRRKPWPPWIEPFRLALDCPPAPPNNQPLPTQ